VFGALLDNLAIPFTRRVVRAADFLDQFEGCLDGVLKTKDLERLIEPVHRIADAQLKK
jgi:hypothetical protein